MKKLMCLVLIFTLAFTSVGSVFAGEELGISLNRRNVSTGNAGALGNLSKHGDDYNFKDNIFVNIEDVKINGSEISLMGSVTDLNTRQIERFNFVGELLKSNIHENKYIGDLKDTLGNFYAVHFSIDENFKTMGEASLKTYLNSEEEPSFTDSFSMSKRFSNEMKDSKAPVNEMMIQNENTMNRDNVESNSINIRGRSFGGSAINLYLMNYT